MVATRDSTSILTAALVTSSFDHLVGAGEQRRRHVEAERLGGRQIDHEIEFGRLLDRDIGWLGATQHLDDYPRSLTIDFSETRTVTREATLFRHVRPLIDCRQPQHRDPFDDEAT